MDRRGHHLFFAIRPDRETAERICRFGAQFRQRHGLTGRPVAPERLHISLNSLGKLPRPDPQIADRAIAAAGAVRMPPFTVALDRVGTWGRGVDPRAIVMWADDGVIGVRLLHAAIHEALAAVGSVRGPEPGLEPHLTLWRDKAEAPLEFVEPISWRIEAFVLLDSVWGEGRHEVLGRWPLVR